MFSPELADFNEIYASSVSWPCGELAGENASQQFDRGRCMAIECAAVDARTARQLRDRYRPDVALSSQRKHRLRQTSPRPLDTGIFASQWLGIYLRGLLRAHLRSPRRPSGN